MIFFFCGNGAFTEERRQACPAIEKATGAASGSRYSCSSEPWLGVWRSLAYLLAPAQQGLYLVHLLRLSVSTVLPCGSVVLHCLVLLPAVPSQQGAGLVRGLHKRSGPLES